MQCAPPAEHALETLSQSHRQRMQCTAQHFFWLNKRFCIFKNEIFGCVFCVYVFRILYSSTAAGRCRLCATKRHLLITCVVCVFCSVCLFVVFVVDLLLLLLLLLSCILSALALSLLLYILCNNSVSRSGANNILVLVPGTHADDTYKTSKNLVV